MTADAGRATLQACWPRCPAGQGKDTTAKVTFRTEDAVSVQFNPTSLKISRTQQRRPGRRRPPGRSGGSSPSPGGGHADLRPGVRHRRGRAGRAQPRRRPGAGRRWCASSSSRRKEKPADAAARGPVRLGHVRSSTASSRSSPRTSTTSPRTARPLRAKVVASRITEQNLDVRGHGRSGRGSRDQTAGDRPAGGRRQRRRARAAPGQTPTSVDAAQDGESAAAAADPAGRRPGGLAGGDGRARQPARPGRRRARSSWAPRSPRPASEPRRGRRRAAARQFAAHGRRSRRRPCSRRRWDCPAGAAAGGLRPARSGAAVGAGGAARVAAAGAGLRASRRPGGLAAAERRRRAGGADGGRRGRGARRRSRCRRPAGRSRCGRRRSVDPREPTLRAGGPPPRADGARHARRCGPGPATTVVARPARPGGRAVAPRRGAGGRQRRVEASSRCVTLRRRRPATPV